MTTYRVTGHIGEDGLFTARLPEGVLPGEASAEVSVEDDPVARAQAHIEELATKFGEDNWLVQIFRSHPPTKESIELWRGATEELLRDREDSDREDPRLSPDE